MVAVDDREGLDVPVQEMIVDVSKSVFAKFVSNAIQSVVCSASNS